MIRKIAQKKLVISALIAVALAGIATASYLWYSNHGKAKPGPSLTSNPTQASDSTKNGTAQTKSSNPGDAAKSTISIQDESKQTSNGGTTSSSLSIFVTGAGQTSNGTVDVRAQVSGGTPSSCQATFSKAGQSDIVKPGTLTFTGTQYSCVLSVPLDQFSAGNWTVKVIAQAGSSSASFTQDFTVTK